MRWKSCLPTDCPRASRLHGLLFFCFGPKFGGRLLCIPRSHVFLTSIADQFRMLSNLQERTKLISLNWPAILTRHSLLEWRNIVLIRFVLRAARVVVVRKHNLTEVQNREFTRPPAPPPPLSYCLSLVKVIIVVFCAFSGFSAIILILRRASHTLFRCAVLLFCFSFFSLLLRSRRERTKKSGRTCFRLAGRLPLPKTTRRHPEGPATNWKEGVREK